MNIYSAKFCKVVKLRTVPQKMSLFFETIVSFGIEVTVTYRRKNKQGLVE